MKRILMFSIAALTAFAIPAAAEEKMSVIPEGAIGKLTLRYFDDSDETAPIVGAEFEILQVAEIGTDFEVNGAYIPLVDGISFEGAIDAEAYEAKVLDAYEENSELGYTAYSTVTEDGTAVFEDIPVGAYLVRNTKTVKHHITSKPFLVSVPETDETATSWNFDVVANPKPNLAGDLKVTKTLEGSEANEDDIFSVMFSFSDEGEYKAVMPSGETRVIHSGDTLPIQGGQSIAVYDLPEHLEYAITEVEANQNGYKTIYKKAEGKISYAEMTETEIINSKDGVKTGVTTQDIALMLAAAGGALAILFLLIMLRKQEKEKANKDE